MTKNSQGGKLLIRRRPIVVTILVGFALIVASVLIDLRTDADDIWSSVLLEIGAAVDLVGVLFIVERTFLKKVQTESLDTIEEIAEIVESTKRHPTPNKLTIDVVPTATDRGQRPKILVRITDPDGDYSTKWLVRITNPKGDIITMQAS